MKLPSYMRLSWQNQSMQGQANICTSFGNIIAKTNTISKRKRQRERVWVALLAKVLYVKTLWQPTVRMRNASKTHIHKLIACTCLPHQVFAHSIQIFCTVFVFLLTVFFFFRFFLLFTLARIPLILIIMFALWHTANCVLMCFLLPHHSIRVPNLMLILNLKATLKLEKL